MCFHEEHDGRSDMDIEPNLITFSLSFNIYRRSPRLVPEFTDI